jgi:transitional endoplasmic reticulum ATPase
MTFPDPNLPDPIPALRAALSVSPDNLPLRLHIAETLLQRGDARTAATEYTQILKLDPANPNAQFGMARSLFSTDQTSAALALLEALLQQPRTQQSDPPAPWLALHARILLQSGDLTRATEQFRRAVAADGSLLESDLADRLGNDHLINDRLNAVPIGAINQLDSAIEDFDSDWGDDRSIERPRINFADVGGMEALKEQIRLKIIYPLANAELYKAYGKAIGGGILMYGPPGCGKTHLARATAGEIQANFIAVGLHDVLDMWLGNSERNLHEIFDRARRNAPCVLFFDEADALAASRADFRHTNARMLINQFLTELDGVQHSNDGVLILAATNAPWQMDSAFRRPGRFDRILFVPPADAPARKQILQLLCQGKPIGPIDFDAITQKTEQFSGADLRAIVDVAIEARLQEAMQSGIPQPLQSKDLLRAIAQVRSSTREWFSTARNYAIHANQDGTYDEILHYINQHRLR